MSASAADSSAPCGAAPKRPAIRTPQTPNPKPQPANNKRTHRLSLYPVLNIQDTTAKDATVKPIVIPRLTATPTSACP